MTRSALHASVSGRSLHPLLRAGLGAVFITTLLTNLLTACSSASDSEGAADSGQVASVAQPSGREDAGKNADPSKSAGKAPQRRLDSTEEETLGMFQPYLQCLKDNEVPIQRVGTGGKVPMSDPSWLYYPSVDTADYPAAEKECDPIRPLMPRELDPKTNHDFMKDFRAQIECLEANGVKVTGLPDGSGFTYRDGYQPDEEAHKIEEDCQMKAFGGKE
ncbi:hypothetical protein LWF15_08400 [Kineosporia rhizophila]|uniref:hypothetical protein n=1 Tax=Kineosporia rhizophila TaxID=84633 RepID=UPI001E444806|nr:hypothetical protein [Kineosporia rhizophila]MCE0535528.1 hypothetical protein [Kineosporia rhizophila]